MKTMLNIKESPYGLLLITAIVLLFVFVYPSFSAIDLKDKTMFNLPLAVVVWLFPLLLISFWLLYVLTKRFLYSMTITRIHVLITVSATILIVTLLYVGIHPSQATIERHELIGNTTQILIIIFVGSQLMYVANVLLGLFGMHKVQR